VALAARFAGFTVTVRVLGTLPEAGVTDSQPPVLAAVAEKVAPVAPLTVTFCVDVEPPAWALKLKDEGVAETEAPAVTVRLTETVVAVPPDGVSVIVPVYGVALGCNCPGLTLTVTVAGVLVLLELAASQPPVEVALTLKPTGDPVELVTEMD